MITEFYHNPKQTYASLINLLDTKKRYTKAGYIAWPAKKMTLGSWLSFIWEGTYEYRNNLLEPWILIGPFRN